MRPTVPTLLAVLLAAVSAVQAADAPGAFVPVRAGEDGRIPAAALSAALDAVGRSGHPRHVVVLVHGFNTPYHRSAEHYEHAAALLRRQFDRLNEPVSVVGLQWPSSAGALREWLPKSFASFLLKKLGFRNAVRDPYLAKIPVDRAVGRVGLRQVVFALQERFPEAGVHLIGHSMGAEVIAHAVAPDITEIPKAGPAPEEPERPCSVGLVALLGADLDYNAIDRAPPRTPGTGLPRLLWVTFPRFDAAEDRALRVRRLVRGRGPSATVFHWSGASSTTMRLPRGRWSTTRTRSPTTITSRITSRRPACGG
jgi:pimeloyl-ACP methyl ester carboxylesterase